MRVLITADLHYDIARSRAAARELALQICATPADALVLVGDTAGADLDIFREALQLFGGFAGRKLLVPGNHCIWCRGEETSLDRYQRILPELAGEEGFEVLDHRPVVLGRVGLAGSIGWYDYSLRDESLGIPREFYEAKLAPGAAAYLGGYEELFEAHGQALGERQMAIGSRWMDGRHVRLGMSDEAFCALLAERLGRQLDELAAEVDRIIVFMHHLPFGELVPTGRPDRFAFAAAFMGARRLGDVLLARPKVTDVYCGHSHWSGRCRIAHMNVVNVGSTYLDKRLEILELES